MSSSSRTEASRTLRLGQLPAPSRSRQALLGRAGMLSAGAASLRSGLTPIAVFRSGAGCQPHTDRGGANGGEVLPPSRTCWSGSGGSATLSMRSFRPPPTRSTIFAPALLQFDVIGPTFKDLALGASAVEVLTVYKEGGARTVRLDDRADVSDALNWSALDVVY